MNVLFKLKSRASRRSRDEVARTLEERFHCRPEQVFPGASTHAMADVYEVRVSQTDAPGAVALLTGLRAVEYAEIEPVRGLKGAGPA